MAHQHDPELDEAIQANVGLILLPEIQQYLAFMDIVRESVIYKLALLRDDDGE